jgi:hypothetical protein
MWRNADGSFVASGDFPLISWHAGVFNASQLGYAFACECLTPLPNGSCGFGGDGNASSSSSSSSGAANGTPGGGYKGLYARLWLR